MISIKILQHFSRPIDSARASAYSLVGPSVDEFDALSFFVVAEQDGEIVGSVRLTDSKLASPLAKWSSGQFQFSIQGAVVELTRGTVKPEMRGLQIYKWMMLRVVREARMRGYRIATAAIEPDFPQRPFLIRLGFSVVREPLTFDDWPRQGTLAQPLLCELDRSSASWELAEREVAQKTSVQIANN